jgi:hypothetical protein
VGNNSETTERFEVSPVSFDLEQFVLVYKIKNCVFWEFYEIPVD